MSRPFHLAELGLGSNAGKAARLAVLMLAAALTEGFGLLLLVPMLGTLSGAQAGQATVPGALGMATGLVPLLGTFVALVVVRAVIVLARNLSAHGLECAVVDGLRQRAWHALLHADWRVLASQRRSSNANLLISEIDRIGYGLNQLVAGLATATTLAALTLAVLVIAPWAALGGVLGGVLVLLAYRGLRRRAVLLGEQIGAAFAAVHAGFSEGLDALRVIKSLSGEARAEVAALDEVAGLRRAQRSYLRSVGLGQIALQGGGAAALGLLVWLAVARWNLALATVLPTVAMFVRALPLLGALQENWQHWNHASPALSSTLALIREAEAARETGAEAAQAPDFRHALRIENASVRFSSEAPWALRSVSLTIPARGLVALVGASGAGKSTLADLAGGLLSPDEGAVTVDDVPLNGALRQAWRHKVAYVQQDPVLFAGTVRDNLLWATPVADQTAILAALSDVSAGFVHDLPQGLDTRVGDGGRVLSGGERQRLMLARALLRKSALLILDEATSALDPASEAAIVAAINRLKEQMGVLVIAHRGDLTALADQVVTLEAGRIAAISRINAGL